MSGSDIEKALSGSAGEGFLSEIFERQRFLQQEVFKLWPGDADGEAADFIDWNITAAVQEFAEMREGIGWKPWASDRGWTDREVVVKEAVDVLHFLVAILIALDVTPQELHERYMNKSKVNQTRQEDGYTHNYKKTKSGDGLAQALDEPTG